MNKISIGTFDCTLEDVEAVVSVMTSGYLSTGKETRLFENKLAITHGKKYGLMVNSGQSALEVAIVCAKVKLNKKKLKIIVPSLTYAATLWAVLNTNCEPIFVDIDEDYNIDCSSLPEADVLLVVDLCGKTANVPIQVRNKYFVIEDACEACGNVNCNYGDIICLSFYVAHIITTGSGGMVLFDDKESFEYAKSYIAHGRFYGGDFTEYADKWVDRFKFDKVGVSYRSDNMAAALGLSQFSRLGQIISKRKENAFYLSALLTDMNLSKFFRFPSIKYVEDCIFQFYPIVILHQNIIREDLLSFLFNRGISSRVLLSLTNQSIFEELFGCEVKFLFPVSQYVNEHGFIVGCHQKLNSDHMKYIASSLVDYIKERNIV